MDWLPLNRQVIRRESNGKTIWQPRIGCWLDDREHDGRGLGEGYEGCNEVTLFERLNCSDRLYVFGRCIRTEYAPDVRVEERRLDALTTEKRILTPLGELKAVLKGNTSNYGVMPIKWLVETPEELEIMRHVEEGMTYAFDQAEYDKLYAERAHLGLPAIYLPRVSIQRLYLDLMGVENATYALYDFPEQVEAYFETLEANQRKLLDVVADSPFEWVNYGDNLHCGMLPPALFEKYVLPVYQRRNERLHRAGKFTFAHWDGDCKALLPYAPETGLDGIEAIKSRRRRQYDVRLRSAAEAEAFCAEPLCVERREAECVTVSVGDDMRPFTQALARHAVTGLESVHQSLEDVFLHYYGQDKDGGAAK